jgi:Mg-chelatase subunit ChlD
MPLSFLAPVFLAGAIAAAVPIVLHLLKRDAAAELRFSAVRLLRRAPVEQRRRQRLRNLLLLALRVTALLLLAAAFARPYLRAATALSAASVTVVAVDRSYSMSAPGAGAAARRLAADALRSAPAESLVAVLAFDDGAEVLAEPTADRGLAIRAIERIEPGFGGTRYRTALGRAAAVIGARPGRIVVVTDLQRRGWESDDDAAVPGRVGVEVIEVAGPSENLAVASFAADRGSAAAVVLNRGSTGRQSRARLVVDERTIAEQAFAVGPGTAAQLSFAAVLPPSGAASVVVDDATGFAADNRRFRALDAGAATRVLLVGPQGTEGTAGFYVERALASAAEMYRFDVATASPAALGGMGDQALAGHAAVVVLSTRQIDRRGRDALTRYVEEGGGALVAAGADVDPAIVSTLFQPPIRLGAPEAAPGAFAPADVRHPIFRPFGTFAANLAQVRFTRAAALEGENLEPLARFSDGRLAMADRRQGRGRVVVFASDLDNRWNDFPVHPTFVPFIVETLRYVGGGRAVETDYTIGAAPGTLPATPGVAMLGGRRVALNVDIRESETARVSPEEFRGAVARLNRTAAAAEETSARQQEERQGLWRYGLLLVAVLLVAESMIGSRAG